MWHTLDVLVFLQDWSDQTLKKKVSSNSLVELSLVLEAGGGSPVPASSIGMQKRFKLFICRVNGTHIEVEAQLVLCVF